MHENNQIRSIPIQYIEQYLPNIFAECLDHQISETEANEIVELIKSTICELDKIKQIPGTTRRFIKENLPNIKWPQDVLFQKWLTMALKQDDLFTYSYDAMAIKQNIEAGQLLYNIKGIDPEFFHPKEDQGDIGAKTESKKVPDKYFALLHLILIFLGKEKQIGNMSKKDQIDFGRNKYNTGQGFYRELNNIDILNITAFVRSLPASKRNKWEQTITEISGNDADVISWLKKQPN